MSVLSVRKGQPLLVLGVLALAWLMVRVATWQSPFGAVDLPPMMADVESVDRTVNVGVEVPESAIGEALTNRLSRRRLMRARRPEPRGPWMDRPVSEPVPMQLRGPETGHTPAWAAPARGMAPTVAAEHQVLFAAAMAHLPLVDSVRQALAIPQPSGDRHMGAISRWTLDAWLLARQGRNGSSQAIRPASYGSSQAGAVLRYRLRPDSKHRPFLYARASRALVTSGETDVAVGVGARPVPSVPLATHAELRVTHAGNDTFVRPSGFVATELPPKALPAGLRAEAYAQAGYVGGRFATGFADGQVRVDRSLAQFDLGELRAGAGAWGGAQKGAERVDIGPTASMKVDIAGVPARVAVDYRVRVAGNAVPGSGVALTFTTGF